MTDNKFLIEIKCSNCNKLFKVSRTYFKRRKEKGQKTFCCSQSCSSKIVKNLKTHFQKDIPKSEEMKIKLRENAKINPNYGMKGKNHKEESCNKIAKSLTGKTILESTKLKISKGNSGINNGSYIDGR